MNSQKNNSICDIYIVDGFVNAVILHLIADFDSIITACLKSELIIEVISKRSGYRVIQITVEVPPKRIIADLSHKIAVIFVIIVAVILEIDGIFTNSQTLNITVFAIAVNYLLLNFALKCLDDFVISFITNYHLI